MMRGTFANIRIRNRMLDGVEGGVPATLPDGGEVMPIYDAAMRTRHDGTPLVVLAGKEYGTGSSSRDWAAKGTMLLGVRAVIAESFERIHRSQPGRHGRAAAAVPGRRERARAWASTAASTFTIRGVADIQPRQDVEVQVTRADGSTASFTARCRIDTVQRARIFPSTAASSTTC